MELNRNHYIMLGVILLLLGWQFRSVDAFVLNKNASDFIATQLKKPEPPPTGMALLSLPKPRVASTPEIIRPPQWLGWAMLSVGGVLILHALAIGRPD